MKHNTITRTMTENMWEQWDSQTNNRHEAYIEMNNLYLAIESGRKPLTLGLSLKLNHLLPASYSTWHPGNWPIIEWWREEFHKLPNWFNF